MKKLRVWWIPQVPMEPFKVDVQNLVEARLMIDALADYDSFQYNNNIKPDYCNVGGLEEFDGEEWLEWEDDDGNNIKDYSLEEIRNKYGIHDQQHDVQCISFIPDDYEDTR